MKTLGDIISGIVSIIAFVFVIVPTLFFAYFILTLLHSL